MKTLHLAIIVIVLEAIGINSLVFAQVLPVPVFETAYFKSDNGTYPIPYQLINATLTSTPLDISTKTLFFEINATSDGQLTVELPRTIIDSKNGSQDKPYYVTTDDIRSLGGPMRVVPEELSEKDVRIVQINFPRGTSEIGISGTYFVSNYPLILQKLESPLKQIKSGIPVQDVKCSTNYVLIIKAEDGSPACVKPDTAQKLMERGWAKEIVTQTSQSSECAGTQVPSGGLGTNIVPILIMSPNSTAIVCVTYNFPYSWAQYPNKEVYSQGILNFSSFSIGWESTVTPSSSFQFTVTPSLFDATKVSAGSNVNVIYKIYAEPNAQGYYDASLPYGVCSRYPLAVVYDASTVDATHFGPYVTLPPPCFNSLYTVSSVKIVSGMSYKEVQFP